MKKKRPRDSNVLRVKDELFIADYLIFCQSEPGTSNQAPGTEHLESSTRDQAPGTKHPEPSIRNQHDTEYVVKAIKPSTPNQDNTEYVVKANH